MATRKDRDQPKAAIQSKNRAPDRRSILLGGATLAAASALSAGAPVRMAHRDAMLTAPAPASVGRFVAEIDLEARRDAAVDGQAVAQHAVGVPGVEHNLGAAVGGQPEPDVLKDQGNVVLREARQMPAGVLVARVVLVEEAVEAGETGVDVGGREVQPVVVIPERAHTFSYVAKGWVSIETSQDIGIVVVLEEPWSPEVAREPVAL